MQQLYAKYRNQGFAMVAINITPSQNEQIPEWRTKNRYNFPVLVTDSNDYARANYGVSATPTDLLLNADHRMVFRHVGYDTGSEKTMEAEIRELLGLDPFAGIESSKSPEGGPKK